jgi:hypothetical protein
VMSLRCRGGIHSDGELGEAKTRESTLTWDAHVWHSCSVPVSPHQYSTSITQAHTSHLSTASDFGIVRTMVSPVDPRTTDGHGCAADAPSSGSVVPDVAAAAAALRLDNAASPLPQDSPQGGGALFVVRVSMALAAHMPGSGRYE